MLAVLGYHFGVPWLSGGLLGVGVFFTLSGFLITGILLSSWERTGGLELRTFWIKRARRLLPALVVMLVVVLAVTVVVAPDEFLTRWHESIASIFYVSNWTTILHGVSYFDRISGPGPLDHLWSLAIEEQFYLVWPLVLLLLLRLTAGSYRAVSRVVILLAAGSFALLALLAAPGFDNTRAYEGTDTRAGELLVGAALALMLRRVRVPERPHWRERVLVDAAGVIALAVIGWLVVSTTQYSIWMYRGGLFILAASTALLLAVVVQPTSLLAKLLALQPLRWVGERSYGIYLWHMPIVALTPQSLFEPYSVRLALFHLGLTLVVAELSWRFIENPIRVHGLRGALAERSWIRRGAYFERARIPALVKGVGGVVLVATVTISCSAVLNPAYREKVPDLAMMADPPVPPAPEPTQGAEPGQRDGGSTPSAAGKSHSASGPGGGPGTEPKAPSSRPDPPSTNRPQSSCTSVVHVGDSTSVGLMSADYLPDPKQRVDAQYRAVGVDHVATDILGARSIVETYKGQPNADEATKRRIDGGYDGCWVFAMGTNDTANQYVGGVVSMEERIARLMDDVDGQPALWLTVKTRLQSGPWQDDQMQKWNDALMKACGEYPNMRVYDWRSEVEDKWFISDGIHFTSAGYRERGSRTADALATAFPTEGDSPDSCLVTPGEQL